MVIMGKIYDLVVGRAGGWVGPGLEGDFKNCAYPWKNPGYVPGKYKSQWGSEPFISAA